MIVLLVAAAVVVGAPLIAALLVAVASHHEEAARTLTSRPPGVLAAAARRLLRMPTGDYRRHPSPPTSDPDFELMEPYLPHPRRSLDDDTSPPLITPRP